MSAASYHKGAAHEFCHQNVFKNINQWRALGAPKLTISTSAKFDEKHKRCNESEQAHYSNEERALSTWSAQVCLRQLLQKEPMLAGAFEFGGCVYLDAPKDEDSEKCNDTRDLILKVKPLAVRTENGDCVKNIHGHQVEIGVSIKRNSNERRAQRAKVISFEDGSVSVDVGNILGIPYESSFDEIGKKLAKYIKPVCGLNASSAPTSYKRFLIHHALQGALYMVKRANNLGQFMEKQLGAFDCHVSALHEAKNSYVKYVKFNQNGTLGANLDANGNLVYPSNRVACVSAIKSAQLCGDVCDLSTTGFSVHQQQLVQNMLAEGYKKGLTKLRVELDNGLILCLRLHNGSSELGYSMIKCSLTIENEAQIFGMEHWYARAPKKLKDASIKVCLVDSATI